MNSFKTAAGILASLFLITACNGGGKSSQNANQTPQGGGDIGGVVKGTAYIPVEVDAQGRMTTMASITYPVTVVNPPNVRFNVNTGNMVAPTISNTMLEFGKAELSDLFDNNLSVCGTGGNRKCSAAYVRMYTTGQPGAGLWNTADGGYGMPIFANMTGSPRLAVGLDATNAAIVQRVAIGSTKRVLQLTDFPTPAYEMRSDFSNAGAGSYSTTLVIEYGLLP